MASRKTTIENQLITERLIAVIRTRLTENKPIRRKLPVCGRVRIDRQLPFLCVYRRPVVGADAGTAQLVTGEASYLFASGTKGLQRGLTALVQTIARTMHAEFGAFLILEVWASAENGDNDLTELGVSAPAFRVVSPKGQQLGALIDRAVESLSKIKVGGRGSTAKSVHAAKWCPKQMSPILSPCAVAELGCNVLGLEVRPIYRDLTSGESYPLVLRELRRGMTRALRKTFYTFIRSHTSRRPRHFHVLGPRAVVKAVLEADHCIAAVAESFDFLLQVTPVNAERSWRLFQKHRYERAPVFQYRPLPMDPLILKRKLYSAPIERIDDPTMAELLREKQVELDRKLSLLLDLNTKRFLHGSTQLFGDVEDKLNSVAVELLDRLPARTREDSKGGHLDPAEFARRAEAEIDYYRRQWSNVEARVLVCDDISSGLMVSGGSLLIAKTASIPAARAHALIQHEVGTHILTYYNGRSQAFRLLSSGLAGYDATQEGLAVVAEYLVGGLSRPRLRLLAARVAATKYMLDGASFVETFRLVHDQFGLERRIAFTLALRIYRGGGLTKDAVYLRGLTQLLEYFADGGDLNILLLGKYDLRHVPVIRELRHREILSAPPLRPSYLEKPAAAARLANLGQGISIVQLTEACSPCELDLSSTTFRPNKPGTRRRA